MRGELIDVWGDTWREIWSPLLKNDEYEDDFLMDFYRMLVPLPDQPEAPDPMTLTYDDAGVMTAESQAIVEVYEAEREAFEELRAEHEEFATGTRDLRSEINDFIKKSITTEADACRILRAVYKIIGNIGDDEFTERYVTLVERFLRKFSLRYDLRRPFHLCPTLPGMFSTLLKEFREVAERDAHLLRMLNSFENAIRDMNIDHSTDRMETALSKQIILLEAVGGGHPNCGGRNQRNTLGAIAEDIGTWPHDSMKDSLKKLYGFTCDYPGIRHGGNPANQIRDIEMRDFISSIIVMSGFLPYLTDDISPTSVFLVP